MTPEDSERIALDNAQESAAAVASAVLYMPRDKVPPCPFPCSICRRAGRQPDPSE